MRVTGPVTWASCVDRRGAASVLDVQVAQLEASAIGCTLCIEKYK